MFEVSWGELTLCIGLGLVLIGRKDLPSAARLAGTQVGRVVGLLQGARARADKFASENELRQLQNELRSGLRELDAVKSELAVSMSTRGVMGRTLGATVGGVNREGVATGQAGSPALPPRPLPIGGGPSPVTPSLNLPVSDSYKTPTTPHRPLPPASQTIAAVAEEEWEKQGIAFRSKAESGAGLSNYDHSTSTSVMLAAIMKESLIFDQYDRVVREQDEALQSRIDKVQREVQSKQESLESDKKDA